ncbi:MAG: hypothetical protein DRO05_03260 [Thermoproteota archaeon]|nr:MAG: hypothetical protein DRO05_03260 [Candidatus Korarchaeota archaeon]
MGEGIDVDEEELRSLLLRLIEPFGPSFELVLELLMRQVLGDKSITGTLINDPRSFYEALAHAVGSEGRVEALVSLASISFRRESVSTTPKRFVEMLKEGDRENVLLILSRVLEMARGIRRSMIEGVEG